MTDADHPGYPTGFTMAAGAGANYTISGLQITPAPNFFGTLTVPVAVTDPGSGVSNSFNLSVSVTTVNDAPVIVSQNGAISTNEDQSFFLVLGNVNVTDVESTYPTGYSMTVAAGANYTFTGLQIFPASNYSGPLTIPVQVTDPGGAISNTFNLSVTVNTVNDLPVIGTQNPVSTTKNTAVTLNLNNLNVTDADHPGYPTGFSMAAAAGANYTVAGLQITPNTNYVGGLTVPVTVTDPGGATSATFNLSITVTDVNFAPVIDGQDLLVTNEDQAITLNLNNLDVTDVDHPSYPTGFTMSVAAGSNYTFTGLQITPSANFFGTLTVPVQVTDPLGAVSNTFNLSITVNSVNDAPVIGSQNGTLTTNEDQSITLALGNVNVTDVESTYPTGYTMAVSAGANYTFTGLQITPASNFFGTLTVPVTVTDPGGANSNTFNLSITVNSVNDAPVIGTQDPLSTSENVAITLTLNDVNVTDVDHPGYPTGFTMTVFAGANYTFSGLQITPASNFSGTLTVPVQVTDPLGAVSNTFNLSITVNDVNTPPSITGQDPLNTNEDTQITLSLANLDVTDVDHPGYPTGFTLLVSAGSNYTFSGLQITPAANFSGTLTVPVQVRDPGNATSGVF